MERIIKMSDVRTAVVTAYDKYKKMNVEGAIPDTRVSGMNAGKMGISVRLSDGTAFDVGDTSTQFAIGSMMRIPLYLQLYTQMTPTQLAEKMGKCGCSNQSDNSTKPKGIHAKNIRLASLVQPIGDADGKMELLSNLMIGLMGSSPLLDDSLYRASVKENLDKGVENMLASSGYELYDDANVAIEVATKLHSMLVTTCQLAEMGATITADGINPVTKEVVFDGKLSASLVAMMAVKGPKKIKRPWLMTTGVPAMSSFGGGFLTVIPGFGSIAAFAPELVHGYIPCKAALAMKEIVNSLGLNVFASARVRVEQ